MYLYETHDWLQKRFDEAVWEIENPYIYIVKWSSNSCQIITT